MTDIIDTKTVREARASARKIARGGQRTYQQALDDVARAAGHDHWAAFVRANPGQPREADGAPLPLPRPARRSDTRAFLQAIVSGEMGQRNQAALENSALEGDPEMQRSIFRSPVLFAGLAAIVTDGVILSMYSQAVWLGMTAATMLSVLILQTIARLVGDHPSMVLRRAQLLLVTNIAFVAGLGLALFSALMFYRYPGELVASPINHHLTNIDGVAYGLAAAVFFRVVGTQGVKAMAIQAPATVMRIAGTVPVTGSTAPGWLTGLHDLGCVLCLLAGFGGLICSLVALPVWILGFDTHGAGGWGMNAMIGATVLGWVLDKASGHFRRLGYLPEAKDPTPATTRAA